MDALIDGTPRKKKKRYVVLIFGDGGSMNAVLFPSTPGITLAGFQTRVIGPLWSIAALRGAWRGRATTRRSLCRREEVSDALWCTQEEQARRTEEVIGEPNWEWFRDNFNTKLTPKEEADFQQWLRVESKRRKSDLSKDLYTYDLRGAGSLVEGR